jgi:hypothetical protein
MSEKIDRLPAASQPSTDEGDDVAETRSPDAIQKEIEQTRAELAETIDAIADRISPKRAATRGAAAVKAGVSGVFGGSTGTGTGNGSASGRAPAAVLDAPPAAASHTDTQRRQREISAVASSGGGSAYAGSAQYSVKRTLRTDRVLLAVGAVASAVAVAVLWRSRRR